MARRNTRELILQTSLALFNEWGEPNVTTNHIADEADISPGNLYYHFRSKDDIVLELFKRFLVRFQPLIEVPPDVLFEAEDLWFQLHMSFEIKGEFRFLYRNLDDILLRYPDIRRSYRRLLQLKRSALAAICLTLFQRRVMQISEVQMEGLIDNLTLTLNYWFNYDQLLQDSRAPQVSILQGVLQIMTAISPYLGEDQLDFYTDCREIYQRMLESEN